jgi:uncharacterized OsmC-like protein
MSTTEAIASRIRAACSFFAQNPAAARVEDLPIRAEWLGGLRVRATDGDGRTVETDMPREIGGTGERMTPGTLLRTALAACDATRIAMAAAQRGVELSRLEVEVTSTSDLRGLLGLDGVEPGPLGVGMRYRLASETAGEDELRALAEEAERCSPVLSALRREIPVSVELDLGALPGFASAR